MSKFVKNFYDVDHSLTEKINVAHKMIRKEGELGMAKWEDVGVCTWGFGEVWRR